MKKTFFPFAAFALAAMALTLFPGGGAEADERGITLTSHRCQLCSKEYYTFKPDTIDGTRSETRTRRYQDANWHIFKGKRAIPACSRADGAHLFRKGSDIRVDAATVVKMQDRIVYLRNGGGSLQARLVRMKCLGCGMEAHAFACDDLGYGKPIDIRQANDWTTMKGERPRSCNWRPAWPRGGSSPFHFMKETGRTTLNSRDLANIMDKVLCSKP